MTFKILISILAFCFSASGQFTCPEVFPEECICEPLEGRFRCITVPMEMWDIKATFDEIADTINDDFIVYHVLLQTALLGQQQEVPAHSISLEAINIVVYGDKLTRIDPEAFSGSHDSVASLKFFNMNFTNPQEAFNLFNNFRYLSSLEVSPTSTLQHIPANAFSSLEGLTWVFMDGLNLESIGEFAFTAPINLTHVRLSQNNFTLDSISDKAFEFIRQDVTLILQDNPGITHLREEKFKTFVSGQNNNLLVGQSNCNGDCGDENLLYCDERVDWLCDTTYLTRINGYECKGQDYVDIVDYCQKSFREN